MNDERTLANGVTIRYLNESKKLAGDRWLVKLRCHATIPIQEWMREAMAGPGPENRFCRDHILSAGVLHHDIVRERNFIDAKEREGLFTELLDSLETTTLGYLASEPFVRQLFAKKHAEAKQLFTQQGHADHQVDDDDPPGPADFSDCFR